VARATPRRADRESAKTEASEGESLAFARAVLENEAARKLDSGEREGIAKALVRAEIHHDLPVALSLAIIKQESRFDPAAKGPSGSIGLMQLQPATARAIARRTGLRWTSQKLLRDPEVNVRLGLAYLIELRERFQNTEHAVGAYNIGPTKMRRLLARRPFRRGPYLTKVYGHAEALRDAYRD
jgi:soluble lytic murein transglycosylase-like protein